MAPHGQYHEITIEVAASARDDVVSGIMDLGCLGIIERDTDIVAYFPTEKELLPLLDEVRAVCSRYAGPSEIRASLIPHEDWNRSWKAGFKPLDVGARFTVLPPWETPHPGRMNIVIDPGMAFGTGHHETTRSCLQLMERLVPSAGGSRFLDLGTGTGLLAIAAKRLGFTIVVALDLDPLAAEATRLNMSHNAIDAIEVVEGEIDRVPGPFDAIAANLISGVLVSLAPHIASRLAPGGLAILSGILKGQEDEVIEAMRVAGLAFREGLPDGKWVSLLMQRA